MRLKRYFYNTLHTLMSILIDLKIQIFFALSFHKVKSENYRTTTND